MQSMRANTETVSQTELTHEQHSCMFVQQCEFNERAGNRRAVRQPVALALFGGQQSNEVETQITRVCQVDHTTTITTNTLRSPIDYSHTHLRTGYESAV